ncbi:hypothetical protein CCACVL1_17840 [Corchorus capsularis]|uniref:Uncharacterized protein n=1 Tax=Corchorus capsularis TaxID=210143 RepID=A0A1R3HPQ7_COCAP|nr:hypothetical protein CCACVL1_17840 [Corchorus capsularis]
MNIGAVNMKVLYIDFISGNRKRRHGLVTKTPLV